MGATKSKKSKSAKQSKPSPNQPIKIGGAPNKELSKLYAAMALAPENKKFLYQRLIDFIENK